MSHPEKVLIVDDHRDNLEMYATHLRQHGYSVLQATDGMAALEIAHDELPDLILMDLLLPRLDGSTAIRLLKNDPDTAHIRIIAMTASYLESDRHQAQRAGCDAYLPKPCLPKQVLDQVDRLVGRRRNRNHAPRENGRVMELPAREQFDVPGNGALGERERDPAMERRERDAFVLLQHFYFLARADPTGHHSGEQAAADLAFTPAEYDALLQHLLQAGFMDYDRDSSLSITYLGREYIESLAWRRRSVRLHDAARGVMTVRSKTVLVVEDNYDNRAIYVTILRHAGHATLEARNGIEGIQMAREHLPDLILMDLSMPGIDGWEATRMLKEGEDTRDIPVCALSAHVLLAGDWDRVEQAGFACYLTKPIEPKEVLHEITSWIGPGEI